MNREESAIKSQKKRKLKCQKKNYSKINDFHLATSRQAGRKKYKLWSRPPIPEWGWTKNFSNRHFQRQTFLSASASAVAEASAKTVAVAVVGVAGAGRHTDRRCPAGSLAMPVGWTLAADCGLRWLRLCV